jgi:hypothetical protein
MKKGTKQGGAGQAERTAFFQMRLWADDRRLKKQKPVIANRFLSHML